MRNRFGRSTLLIFLATSSLILHTSKNHAQESDLGNWLIYFGNVKINNDWNWHNEIQYRNYDLVGDLEQLLIRTGFGYNLTENNNNIMLGYGYIRSENYATSGDKIGINEHRIFQQFITKQNFGRVFITHRYRFEQRFVEDDFKMRFRYFLSLNVPINNSKMIDNTFYLSGYNEIFLATDSPIFDRNRIYGGVGYRINETFKVELGYMNQLFEKTSRDQTNMILFINL